MHLLATGQSRKYDGEQPGTLAADVSHARAETEASFAGLGWPSIQRATRFIGSARREQAR